MRTMLIVLGFAAAAATAVQAVDLNTGRSVYNKTCKSCHGADGTPSPAVAKMTKVDMKDLKSANVQAMSDGDLKKIIGEGKGKMKPVASVSGSAADNVIAYIRSWKK
jgi:mono/diheme cytochrome c family protein